MLTGLHHALSALTFLALVQPSIPEAQNGSWEVTEQRKSSAIQPTSLPARVSVTNNGPNSVVVRVTPASGQPVDVVIPAGSSQTVSIPSGGSCAAVNRNGNASGTWVTVT